MRVHDHNVNGAAAPHAGQPQHTQPTSRTGEVRSPAAENASTDRVVLSSLAGQLSRLLETAAAQRASRVESLGSLYAQGKYTLDSGAVARAMIAEMLAAGPAVGGSG